MFEEMIGLKIKKVYRDNDGETLIFEFRNGTKKKFETTGDCCSHSWIEHLELPDEVNGAIILAVEEGNDTEPYDNHECKPKNDYENECGHDVLKVYNTIFKTDKGNIIVEYRNDSNGYYGGSLVEVK